MADRPIDSLEGAYEVDVSTPEGTIQRFQVKLTRLADSDIPVPRVSIRDIAKVLGVEQERFAWNLMTARETPADTGVNVDDVMKLLDDADQELAESTALRRATREGIEKVEKELDKLANS